MCNVSCFSTMGSEGQCVKTSLSEIKVWTSHLFTICHMLNNESCSDNSPGLHESNAQAYIHVYQYFSHFYLALFTELNYNDFLQHRIKRKNNIFRMCCQFMFFLEIHKSFAKQFWVIRTIWMDLLKICLEKKILDFLSQNAFNLQKSKFLSSK